MVHPHPYSRNRRKPKTLTDNFRSGADVDRGLSGRRRLFTDDDRHDNTWRLERAGQPDYEHEYLPKEEF